MSGITTYGLDVQRDYLNGGPTEHRQVVSPSLILSCSTSPGRWQALPMTAISWSALVRMSLPGHSLGSASLAGQRVAMKCLRVSPAECQEGFRLEL
ncbi:hypothetical protein FRB94_005711 [Tulasnella sp. JGI-2019a]|nr:hypothetical protein FRB93_003726 [Tulasnella sp. JGI-2019a]KAG9000028.1 hypothetical protein FRB94_005711 [Tulasnella sp. JGI-2019a]